MKNMKEGFKTGLFVALIFLFFPAAIVYYVKNKLPATEEQKANSGKKAILVLGILAAIAWGINMLVYVFDFREFLKMLYEFKYYPFVLSLASLVLGFVLLSKKNKVLSIVSLVVSIAAILAIVIAANIFTIVIFPGLVIANLLNLVQSIIVLKGTKASK